MKTWDFGMKYISGTLIFNITLEIFSIEGSAKFTFWNILERKITIIKTKLMEKQLQIFLRAVKM